MPEHQVYKRDVQKVNLFSNGLEKESKGHMVGQCVWAGVWEMSDIEATRSIAAFISGQ